MASTQERQQKLKLFPLNVIKHYKSFGKCGYLLLQHAVERTFLWNYVWNAWISVNICKLQLLQSLKSRVSQQPDCFIYQTISVPENSRKSFYQFFLLDVLFSFCSVRQNSVTSQLHTVSLSKSQLKNRSQVNEHLLSSVHQVLFEACYNTLSVFSSVLLCIN